MRTYTLSFSILVHLIIVGVLIVSPIVANDTPPEPRRTVEFIEVRPIQPRSIPRPPRGSGQRTSKGVSASAAPVAAPDRIAPDSGIEPSDVAGDPEGVPDGIPGGDPGGSIADLPEPLPPAPKPAAPVPVGGSIKRPQRIRDVAPVYPAFAQSARVEGTVILQATIGEDGRVSNLSVLRSIPLLDAAAMDAVRQWQFTPTLLNGQPVSVVMTVTVTFTLRR